tara:strand:- start:2334 stop:3200 length:867 start_codon:yes stop_codon:yes gene_type:complete
MRRIMKNIWKPLATGIGITVVLTLFMLFLTMNFQYVLWVGACLFYIGGRVHAENKNKLLFLLLGITWSFTVLFTVLVLTEIPKLYYITLIFIIACLLGLYFKKNRKMSLVGSIALIMLVAALNWKVIPADLTSSLTQQINKPLPSFVIKEMNGGHVSENSIEGNVVVFDFFGTWCKPCKQELKELDKVQHVFKNEPDVVFYVVNADLGGDTPEKFENFIAKTSYNFKYAYDDTTQFLKSLQLGSTGLPCLVIVDKKGYIRMVHIGFNTAETNFVDHLVSTIKALQAEK